MASSFLSGFIAGRLQFQKGSSFSATVIRISKISVALGIAIFWFPKEAWGVRLRWLLIGLMLVGTGVTLSVPLLRERFQEAINHNNQYGLEQVGGGTSFRLAKWESVQRLWEKMPVQGYGIGDVQKQLNGQYEADHHPQLRNYNAHNQYFQTALGLGVPGLILLVILLFYPLFPKPPGFFALSFCLLFALCIFTESMLEVQKGVLFFSFFSGLTLLGKKAEPDPV